MRSLVVAAAAPTSRVRRMEIRRPRLFSRSAVEASGRFGSATGSSRTDRPVRMGLDRRRLHHGALYDDAGGCVPPQGDEERARVRNDNRLAGAPRRGVGGRPWNHAGWFCERSLDSSTTVIRSRGLLRHETERARSPTLIRHEACANRRQIAGQGIRQSCRSCYSSKRPVWVSVNGLRRHTME